MKCKSSIKHYEATRSKILYGNLNAQSGSALCRIKSNKYKQIPIQHRDTRVYICLNDAVRYVTTDAP